MGSTTLAVAAPLPTAYLAEISWIAPSGRLSWQTTKKADRRTTNDEDGAFIDRINLRGVQGDALISTLHDTGLAADRPADKHASFPFVYDGVLRTGQINLDGWSPRACLCFTRKLDFSHVLIF